MTSDRYRATGSQAESQSGSGNRVLGNTLTINCSALRWPCRAVEGEGQMGNTIFTGTQFGFNRLDMLAGFDGGGNGHGADDGVAAGDLAAARIGGHGCGSGTSLTTLPDSGLGGLRRRG